MSSDDDSLKDFSSHILRYCEAKNNFSPKSTSSRNFDVNIGLAQVDGSSGISDFNSPTNNDVISGPNEVKVPSSKAGCSKTEKMLSTGSLKANSNIASNVTASTIYDKSSISINSLDSNDVFNSPYNVGSSSSSIAVNPFRCKNLQVIMEEKRQFLNRSNLVTTAAQKAVVDRLG